MEENKKLDNLFEQARNATPIVGFDEVAADFKGNLSAQNANTAQGKSSGGSSTAWIVASVATIAIATGAWFYFNTDNKIAAPAYETTVTQSPAVIEQQQTVAQQQQTSSPASSTSSINSSATENTNPTSASTTEIITETEAQPVALTNLPKSKEEEALFAAGTSKNAPPAPIYKKVDGYEKTKTEVLTSEAKATTKTKVGSNKSFTITNSKGNFKLKYLNGNLETLELNSEPVAKNNWSQYNDVIEQGNKKIAGGTETSPVAANDFTQVMIKEMAKDNLFTEDTRKVSLTKEAFTINDAAQSTALHNKYLDLYKKINGGDIGKNTVKFKR